MVGIKDGGQLLALKDKLKTINVCCDKGSIQLWLIDDKFSESLTFLTIEEALKIRNELNKAIKDYCKI